MTATRRGQPELHVRLPSSPSIASVPDLPPISALFLIDFDVKAGYTISWKASQTGLELEGVVEYKSLPSGLHTVHEDLIYFVHDGHAGLSAFVNAPVEDTEARNARMIAVGVLVPLSYGRLGRAWRHAEGLKTLASALATNSKEIALLEQYWEKHQARDTPSQHPATSKEAVDSPSVSFQSPKNLKRGHARKRSASDGAALIAPGHKLTPYHPAWSLTSLLDTFGPLIFPIQRAALLRKRILISGHAPVQEMCNFVYNISILSNIPLSAYDLVSSDSPPYRLRPLFSIGVHDIPFLMDDAKASRDRTNSSTDQQELGTGWIACTTDSILSNRDTLWDMLITMPPAHAANAKKHIWPTVECSHGVPVKATQRDFRRFHHLKAGLVRLQATANSPGASPTTPRTMVQSQGNDSFVDDADPIIEPMSWTALAYSGFMWWASAGEQARTEQAEEASHDSALLANLNPASMSMNMSRSVDLDASLSSLTPRRSTSAATTIPLDPDEARTELAIIAYFHRLTTQILTTLADIVESTSDDAMEDESPMEEDDALIDSSESEVPGRGVRIGDERMKRMGLDIWSPSDNEFVKETLKTYFDRKAFVEGKGVEVCGVRVC
ncbi:hypothetical protein F5Y15DRAFT_365972 [Xylariaceae sp. FL0016]|nr:hypothetical protein F5Y15DRAFT_365972 [Xylariaceae sp. FL0016]